MKRWHDAAMALLPPGTSIYDAHTHTGWNDPDGVASTAAALARKLASSGQAGAVVMPNQDPSGYHDANDRVLAEAREAPDVELIPFARVDPNEGPAAVAEVERCAAAGARGIKVHPRAEGFALSHPVVGDIARAAAERSLPVITHAGRGIPSLGEDALRLCESVPELRLILAHAAISDLSWIGPHTTDVPGLHIDTSWWDLTDLLALMTWVAPSRILYASDTPYGHPSLGMVLTARAAAQSGYDSKQVEALFAGNLMRVLDGGPTLDDAPPPLREAAADPALTRVHALIRGAVVLGFASADAREQVSLAILGCRVPDGARSAGVLEAVARTLESIDLSSPRRSTIIRPLLVTAAATLTPDVPVPDLSG